MNSENHVIFKGGKDGLTVFLSPEVEYDTLKFQLGKKLEAASRFFDGVKMSITFKGKDLTEEQVKELTSIIVEKSNMNITFVKTKESESKPMTSIQKNQLAQHNLTKFYKGAIRSGQSIEFDGSIVIIGDVNPGAEVRATGNIIVLGALKGLAHAGYKGMTDAFVSALTMAPVQLRIADIITRFPEEEILKTDKMPEYAYIEDNQIYVVPLM
ncbi:MAG: septum site-determining protein MinC [Clostridiales bacterium]|nr:septum site-determining protein MinC [Clostridiales bacterium]